MSTLADRVRTIVTPRPAQIVPWAAAAMVPEVAPAAAPPDVATEAPGRAATPAAAAAAALGGRWCDGCLIVERRWNRTARHGTESVGALGERLSACAADASFFAGGAPARAPFLFFDIETTGLSGGAGTQVFLVGTGVFETDEFVTRQFVVTRHADERPMLRRVADECACAGTLVSFNGKSFDAPLLETRYLLHRMEWFAAGLPHIDVLHPARQFWKREDCSLGALEQQLLGCRRTGDVHGFEVPARYFHFVRSGDPRPLAAVLDHNRRDLISLAALTARLLHVVASGPARVRDSREALALGHLYARAGMDAHARDAYARAITLSRAPRNAFEETKVEALRALALAWRRARRFDHAACCWRELLTIRGCPPPVAREAAEALAIHSEHRLRDFAAARAYVGDRFEDWPEGRKRDAIAHRLQRLDRKLRRDADGERRPQTASGGGADAAGRPLDLFSD